MKKILTSIFLLSFSLIAYAGDAEKLIGTWRYVQSASADGSVDTSLGEHPRGYIIYTRLSSFLT